MSIIFDEWKQSGYVVPDLNAAIEQWATVGVGPFYRFDLLPVVNFAYQGSTVCPPLSIALGNFGEVQLELIQPLDGTPSPHRDFLAARPEGGLHHVSTWSEEFDADLARCAAQGLVPDCTGEVADFARFCYFRSAATDGTTLEIADSGTSEVLRKVSALIRAAARQWDGTRPTRRPDELYELL